MTVTVETSTFYSQDSCATLDSSHQVVSGSGAGRLIYVLLHSTSSDNSAYSSVSLTNVTLAYLTAQVSLRNGVYHRLEIYYALDTAISATGTCLFTCAVSPNQHNCQVALLNMIGAKQQIPTNLGSSLSKTAALVSAPWTGIAGAISNSSLSIQQSDATGLLLPSSKNNMYGFAPAPTSADTCQSHFCSSDGTNTIIVSAAY